MFATRHGRALGTHRAPDREGRLTYVARHGQGYKPVRAHVPRHRHRSAPVRPLEDPGEDLSLTTRTARPPPGSLGDRVRRGVLGVSEGRPARSSSPRSTPTRGACWRGTPGNSDFGDRVAFATRGAPDGMDRGPDRGARSPGSLDHPRLLDGARRPTVRTGRAGRITVRGALRRSSSPAGRARGDPVLPGQAATAAEARALLGRYRTADSTSRGGGGEGPSGMTSSAPFQVRNTRPSMDVMLNQGSCPDAGLTGLGPVSFYQAGGAYGFRDQLQDRVWR